MRSNGVSYSKFPFLEFILVSSLVMLAAGVWIAVQGGAVSWDAFNHHIYLGRQAIQGSRLQHDYFAAGSMSCQYPLGYAPLVAMLDAGWPGTIIFQVLTFFAALSAPACWLIAWTVVPSRDRASLFLRLGGTFLAVTGVLWWKILAQTSNDAIGLSLAIWSVALAMLCVDGAWAIRSRWRIAVCAFAGALAGLALVVKLTQFIAILASIGILLFANARWTERFKLVVSFGVAVGIVVLLTGGAWAHESWKACGSPIYPFMLDYFRN